jgi:hypothetical protein
VLRSLLSNPPTLLGLCVVALIVADVRARPQDTPARPAPPLRQFATLIDKQYHECVPLGWFPDSRPWRGYFPGFNADVSDKGALFQAIWVGVVPARTLNDPHATAVKAVLDEFTGLGLLERHALPGAFRYNLTHEGERYYYERNHLGNNVEGWSYLCFSRLHARELAWVSRPSDAEEPTETASSRASASRGSRRWTPHGRRRSSRRMVLSSTPRQVRPK